MKTDIVVTKEDQERYKYNSLVFVKAILVANTITPREIAEYMELGDKSRPYIELKSIFEKGGLTFGKHWIRYKIKDIKKEREKQ